jgi:hypothetical protein
MKSHKELIDYYDTSHNQSKKYDYELADIFNGTIEGVGGPTL